MTLTQVNWPRKHVFQVSGDSMLIKSSRWGNYNETRILLENIGSKKLEVKTAKSGFLIAGIATALIALILLISRSLRYEIGDFAEVTWLVISIICLTIFYVTKQHYIKLEIATGGYLYIDVNKPDKETAAQFINELSRRGRYGRATSHQNVKWN